MKKRLVAAAFTLFASAAAFAAPPCSMKTSDEHALPLHYSASRGDVKNVRCLLGAGASVNATDKEGWTALMVAANSGQTAVARLLIGKGANIKARNKGGSTALMWAAHKGQSSMLKLLLAHGADAKVANKLGFTALMWAAQGGHTDIVKLLLEKGAAINAAASNGDTALMWAARKGHADTVRLLLNKNARTDTKNRNGETALMLAQRTGHTQVAALLASHANMAGATKPQPRKPHKKNTSGTSSNDTGLAAALFAAALAMLFIRRRLMRIVLTADERGHFYCNGFINGSKKPVQFMIDTGATNISLGASVADALGLDYKTAPRITVSTANGMAENRVIQLRSVRVGRVTIHNVEAYVGSGLGNDALLGNNFLNNFYMQRKGNRMMLKRL